MRILYVLPGGQLTGITTGVLGLIGRLDPRYVHATVALLHPGPAQQAFEERGIEVRVYPASGAPTALSRFLRRSRMHVVQSCDAAIAGACAAAQARLPHIWFVGGRLGLTFFGIPPHRLPILRGLIESLSATIVVPAHTLAREEFPHLTAPKLHVIPWGVDLTQPGDGAASQGPRHALGIPAHVPLVAMVGNFYPAKRHRDFLDMAAWIHARTPHVQFIMAGTEVGESPAARAVSRRYHHGVLDEIKRRRLRAVVHVSSFPYEARRRWYRDLTLLVSPAHEGMSQAVLEASACGVPIVAANAGGAPEVIRDGRSGLLIPYGHPRLLAQAVLRLLVTPALARRLAAAAHHDICVRFSAQWHAMRFQRLYESLITQHP